MGITPNFTMDQVKKAFAEKVKRIDVAIVQRMIFVGEQFVRDARANGTYTDQTGNLRSSICYIVLKDGKKRSPGSIPALSRKYMSEITAKYFSGYVLIVVTGMGYAAAVESKGKDVITGSSTKAKKDLDRAMKNFKNLK